MNRLAARFVALGIVACAIGAATTPARAGQILVDPTDWADSRSTPSTSGVVGLGRWAPGTEGGLQISWNITLNAGIYTYSYTFLNANGTAINPDVSHFLLEVSPTFTLANLLSDNFDAVAPTTYTADPNSPNSTSPGANNGNPNLPADIGS